MVKIIHYIIAGENKLTDLFEKLRHQGIDKIIDMREDANSKDPDSDWRNIQKICRRTKPIIEYAHVGDKINIANPNAEVEIENMVFNIIMESAEKSVALMFDPPEEDKASQFDLLLFYQNMNFTIIKLPECAVYWQPKKKEEANAK